jgi:type II secretory pathway pseudopilin PulG
MTGLYVFGVLIIIGIVALVVVKTRMSKASRIEEQARATRIVKANAERVAEEAARTAAKNS